MSMCICLNLPNAQLHGKIYSDAFVYFIDNISNIIDSFGKPRENFLILGKINMEVQEEDIAPLLYI